jgi:hypothetical protein
MQTRREAVTAVGLLVAGGLASPAFAQGGSSTASLAERFAATLSAHDIDGFAAPFFRQPRQSPSQRCCTTIASECNSKARDCDVFQGATDGIAGFKSHNRSYGHRQGPCGGKLHLHRHTQRHLFWHRANGSVVALHFVRYFPGARRADCRALEYGRYRRRPSSTPRVIFQRRRCPLLPLSDICCAAKYFGYSGKSRNRVSAS